MIRFMGLRPQAEVRAFVDWLESVMDIRHPIRIELVAGALGGVCIVPGRPHPLPAILVATDRGLGETLDTIAHEMVHYEQWRDKREMNERGVNQRAAALVRRWQRERT
jgi:hypothetical protein